MTDTITVMNTVLMLILAVYSALITVIGYEKFRWLKSKQDIYYCRFNKVEDRIIELEHKITQIEYQIKKWE